MSSCSSTTSMTSWFLSWSSRLVLPSTRKLAATCCLRRSSMVRRGQQVAGNLLADELVERHVGVEGVDHVVAESPGGRENEAAQRQRLGETGDVEPVPPPALAEVRRGEQTVDERFISDRRRIVDERIDFLGRRRQSDQVERQSACQGRAVGVVRGANVPGFEGRQEEAIDIGGGPGTIAHRRAARTVAAVGRPRTCGRRRCRSPADRRPPSGEADPAARVGAPILTQRSKSPITASGSFPLGGISIPSCRSASSSRLSSGFPPTIAGPESPPFVKPSRVSTRSPPLRAFDVRRMAGVTLLHQHRADLLLEELDPGLIIPERGRGRSGAEAGE